MRAALCLFAVAAIALSTACRPEKCACAFDNKLEAAIGACPSDTTFEMPDMGGAADLAKVVLDDGGAPIAMDLASAPADLSGNADMGPPSSCIPVYSVVLADAPLRKGRSPLSLVIDTLALDETVTAIAEKNPFTGDVVYRIVERGNTPACGYAEANALVETDKSRTTKRSVDPKTDSATCIGGRK